MKYLIGGMVGCALVVAGAVGLVKYAQHDIEHFQQRGSMSATDPWLPYAS